MNLRSPVKETLWWNSFRQATLLTIRKRKVRLKYFENRLLALRQRQDPDLYWSYYWRFFYESWKYRWDCLRKAAMSPGKAIVFRVKVWKLVYSESRLSRKLISLEIISFTWKLIVFPVRIPMNMYCRWAGVFLYRSVSKSRTITWCLIQR